MMTLIRFAILTVSDTCSIDQSKDTSGPTLIRLVSNTETKTGEILKGHVSYKAIVPDDRQKIEDILKEWSSLSDVHVILTTGGTGFSDRDVTPEATKNVIEKETPGISLAMLNASLKITPMAMLSRLTSGIKSKTLIINLPGSSKAVAECLEAVAIAIPHAVDLILGINSKITEAHKIIQNTCQHTCAHKSEILSSQVEGEQRLRESPYSMISVESALKLVEENVDVGEVETISVSNAFGMILRENVYSVVNLPPFRASIKDGYAVLATDHKGRREVVGRSDAGAAPNLLDLKSGSCVWVNTGAPIPNNATAVVQVEDTVVKEYNSNGEETEIDILVEPKAGQDIRPIGSDIAEGALVLNENIKICEVEMGLLVSCGCLQVKVSKVPIVGLLSTGNELQIFGESLKPGHIYDSNKITLMSMLKNLTCVATDFGIVVDNKLEIIHTLEKALSQVDVLVTTGSLSMGDRDFLKPVLKNHFQAVIHFGRLNMKPGKPTTFATCNFQGKKKYILCLPGNPVSAIVTAHLFLQPILNRLNASSLKPVIVKTKLTFSCQLDVRPEYIRVILQWNDSDPYPKAYTTGNQISSKLLNCRNANALLLLPSRTEKMFQIKEGDLVNAMLLNFNQYIFE